LSLIRVEFSRTAEADAALSVQRGSLGTFLDNLDDVPTGVVNCVARPLRIDS